jgi:hypothetical protein
MGLANVDNGFVAKATLAEAQRCVFSGVPAANADRPRSTCVNGATFSKTSGVWGSFTYDSARPSQRSTGLQPRLRPRRASAPSEKATEAPPARSRSTRRPVTGRTFPSASLLVDNRKQPRNRSSAVPPRSEREGRLSVSQTWDKGGYPSLAGQRTAVTIREISSPCCDASRDRLPCCLDSAIASPVHPERHGSEEVLETFRRIEADVAS